MIRGVDVNGGSESERRSRTSRGNVKLSKAPGESFRGSKGGSTFSISACHLAKTHARSVHAHTLSSTAAKARIRIVPITPFFDPRSVDVLRVAGTDPIRVREDPAAGIFHPCLHRLMTPIRAKKKTRNEVERQVGALETIRRATRVRCGVVTVQPTNRRQAGARTREVIYETRVQ